MKQLLRRFGVPCVQAVEGAVKLVRHIGVIKRDGMRVVPQGGDGVPVAETGLGLEQRPLVHPVGAPRFPVAGRSVRVQPPPLLNARGGIGQATGLAGRPHGPAFSPGCTSPVS